ncbi:uncharacterized protein LAESUDRAFT_811503 [Laetiporus sulphureus 93-53]|uniref:DRBM domain-containing protein n=1 Tax=Laetiporus sulphureus 93-53 TaxID=1314785 RepID=A0A165F591_9APHY|nr:uncharacterized protein LAESUDRAFT_811503 [Laetiporus sulphureus 93-53]KZT08417.1 hypothetical protein LAESUDRAFT_811503 [Laetiporus sulphureus 93-53]
MSTSEWRMQLNNWLQANSKRNALTWDVSTSGPKHAPTWTAIAYIDGVQYGRGTGVSRNVATEIAAEQTLTALKRQTGR